jgi:hypothetical protein
LLEFASFIHLVAICRDSFLPPLQIKSNDEFSFSQPHTSLQTGAHAFIHGAAARDEKMQQKRSPGDERADYKLFIKQITLLKGKFLKRYSSRQFLGQVYIKRKGERLILFARDEN